MDPFGYLMVYSNNEWIAYTWSSVHVHNNTVWDHKYPICVVENVLMNNPAVKKAFYKEFARFLAWHDDVAASGRFPTRGSQGLSKQLFRPYSGDDRVRAQGWGPNQIMRGASKPTGLQLSATPQVSIKSKRGPVNPGNAGTQVNPQRPH